MMDVLLLLNLVGFTLSPEMYKGKIYEMYWSVPILSSWFLENGAINIKLFCWNSPMGLAV